MRRLPGAVTGPVPCDQALREAKPEAGRACPESWLGAVSSAGIRPRTRLPPPVLGLPPRRRVLARANFPRPHIPQCTSATGSVGCVRAHAGKGRQTRQAGSLAAHGCASRLPVLVATSGDREATPCSAAGTWAVRCARSRGASFPYVQVNSPLALTITRVPRSRVLGRRHPGRTGTTQDTVAHGRGIVQMWADLALDDDFVITPSWSIGIPRLNSEHSTSPLSIAHYPSGCSRCGLPGCADACVARREVWRPAHMEQNGNNLFRVWNSVDRDRAHARARWDLGGGWPGEVAPQKFPGENKTPAPSPASCLG